MGETVLIFMDKDLLELFPFEVQRFSLALS